MTTKQQVLSAEKSATMDLHLRSDSGYSCDFLSVRISPKQWAEINEIIFRKEKSNG